MIRVLRAVGGGALWVAAAVGVLTCAVWVATWLGWIKPLIVVSGSMEPAIETGSLIISTPRDGSELAPGDVATLHSSITDGLVTHRIVSVEPVGDAWSVTMQGDANTVADPEPYLVTDAAWTPLWVLPSVGEFVADVSRRSVVIPALIGIGALLGLSLLRDPDSDTAPSGAAASESGHPDRAVGADRGGSP
ncbi:signal peptidase I [uncultured Demequina sp.]|uniref:signal peptidase I n=1 Tax=uncultured Demequina sp. TaxID=693499 RepID=UPI0025DD890C|nr:signal peptidase I [uncultured Demequina sp.]